ncbi:MAG: 16S rRNA (cytidine(1402)-2'-O)-methyltransferase [Gammaproteobacteria bacterium]|nr:16S rRNA (cytidine(1402)-2'-O)-methyltransferase [Gammaproteobacteria bacterium]
MTRESVSPALPPGSLHVVATPIGNLGDWSPRARAVLAAVDAVCAEDTRVTGAMLARFGVRRPLIALHEHNEDRLAAALVARLRAGQRLALVSDAGTPLVSDPGYALVTAARAAGVAVYAVPGPSAALAALSISGLPSDRFLFEGFLPAKASARRARLQALAAQPHTWILFESAHRIVACAADLAAVLGRRRVCICRELTKRFEESALLPATTLPDWLAVAESRLRGEFVLVAEGAAPKAADAAEAERVLRALLGELSASKAAQLAAVLTGRPRRELYRLALAIAVAAGDDENNGAEPF